jgi:hypothetical protein
MTPFAGKMVSHGWEVLRSAPDARRLGVGRCSVASSLCRKGGHRNKHARPHVASARATGEPDSQKIESEGGAGDGAARTGVQAEEERRGWQADVGVPLSPRRSWLARPQVGGFATRGEALQALEVALERRQRRNGRLAQITLSELAEEYLRSIRRSRGRSRSCSTKATVRSGRCRDSSSCSCASTSQEGRAEVS